MATGDDPVLDDLLEIWYRKKPKPEPQIFDEIHVYVDGVPMSAALDPATVVALVKFLADHAPEVLKTLRPFLAQFWGAKLAGPMPPELTKWDEIDRRFKVVNLNPNAVPMLPNLDDSWIFGRNGW